MRNKPRPALLMKIHWMRKIKNEMRRIKRKESLFSFQILFPLLLFLFFMWKIEPSSGSQECCAVATDLGRKPSPFPPPTRLTRFLLWTRATTNTTTATAATSAGLVENIVRHWHRTFASLFLSFTFKFTIVARVTPAKSSKKQNKKKRESRQRNEGKVRFMPGPLHTHPHSFCF